MSRSPDFNSRQDSADTPVFPDSTAVECDRINLERGAVSVSVILNSLSPEEFRLFEAVSQADYDPTWGPRGGCEFLPFFDKIAPLFTGRDGKFLSREALDAMYELARQRRIILN